MKRKQYKDFETNALEKLNGIIIIFNNFFFGKSIEDK